MILLPNASFFTFSYAYFNVIPLSTEHLSLYSELYCDSKTMQHVALPLTQSSVRKSFESALKYNSAIAPKRLFLVIFDNRKKSNAGLLGVSAVESTSSEVEVGIMLLQQFHRSGLALDALVSLCSAVFHLIPNTTIIGKINPFNASAKKLVEKVGFVYCSRSSNYKLVPDTFCFKNSEGVKWIT